MLIFKTTQVTEMEFAYNRASSPLGTLEEGVVTCC